MVGRTEGRLPGQTLLGPPDAYVRKYDPDGKELWTRQFGSQSFDKVFGVAVDSPGNLYVVGATRGTLPGQTHLGSSDSYVRKYEPDGKELWTRQFGSQRFDEAQSVAIDNADKVYVAGIAGQAGGAYVHKYDADGKELWTRQFGSDGGFSAAVAVDRIGNLYVAGRFQQAILGQTNGFVIGGYVRKYDSNGNELWSGRFSIGGNFWSGGVEIDGAGNLYAASWSQEWLAGQNRMGSLDAYLRKYDFDGNLLWIRQFGNQGYDEANGLAVDGEGNVYVVGRTEGRLPGQTGFGSDDAYVRKYDPDGREFWTRQIGSRHSDMATSVAIDGAGNLYVVGRTEGTLPGQSSSEGVDAFVLKMSASP